MQSVKQQLFVIVLIVFIGFIGVAMPFPVFAPMFLHARHNSIVPENWHHAMRGIFLGIVLAAYPFGQFIGSTISGNLSDKYGRKKILLLCLIGTTFGCLITAVSIYFSSIIFLILSRFLTGILGGSVAIARTMAADLNEINKYRGFGLIGVATTLGYIIGPVFGGILSENNIVSWFDYYLPFCFSALLSLIAFFFALLYLKESIKLFHAHHANLIEKLNLFASLKKLKQNQLLARALTIMFFLSLCVDTYYEFYPAYLAGQWKVNSIGIGIFTLVLAVAVGIGDFFLVPLLSKYFRDAKTMIYFSFLLIASIGSMLFVNQLFHLYISFFIGGLAIAITTTTLLITISNVSHADAQGQAMGLALSFRTLGDSIICLIGGLLISVSFKVPLLLSIIFGVCALWIQTITANKTLIL